MGYRIPGGNNGTRELDIVDKTGCPIIFTELIISQVSSSEEYSKLRGFARHEYMETQGDRAFSGITAGV